MRKRTENKVKLRAKLPSALVEIMISPLVSKVKFFRCNVAQPTLATFQEFRNIAAWYCHSVILDVERNLLWERESQRPAEHYLLSPRQSIASGRQNRTEGLLSNRRPNGGVTF
jgi:hypothetical protein